LRFRALIAATFFVMLGAAPKEAMAADNLVDAVWELVEDQDRAVDGGASNQYKIHARIDERIASQTADDWKQLGNYRAAVIYVLAGGTSRRLRALLRDHTIEEKDPPLLTASLAYADGDRDAATKLMSSIDARIYPPILAGHLSLVRGGLMMGSNNIEASKLLAFARLVMPASQVEEAALRRELAIIDPRWDADHYLLLARRYQTRYSKSPFAIKYWQTLSAALSKARSTMDANGLLRFAELYKTAPHDISFEFHAMLARASIVTSRLEMLKSQAQAADSVADNPQNKERLKLYVAAIHMMEGDTSGEELKNIASSALSKEEITILNSLRGVGAKLEDSDPQPTELAATPDQKNNDADHPLLQKLQQSLDETGKLLQRAGQ
jgi:chemotaxis protein MotC